MGLDIAAEIINAALGHIERTYEQIVVGIVSVGRIARALVLLVVYPGVAVVVCVDCLVIPVLHIVIERVGPWQRQVASCKDL